MATTQPTTNERIEALSRQVHRLSEQVDAMRVVFENMIQREAQASLDEGEAHLFQQLVLADIAKFLGLDPGNALVRTKKIMDSKAADILRQLADQAEETAN